ncbi:MAG: aspartate carbamoyltransferase regulatory subunit [archaeon GW2011_AR10]|uniref:Aspartate carbamoyltransferase regulatory chain n=2 Tax=Candidatus Iainarchaeum sp. TaxID=3101447 RepID=A0A7J4IX72_9ARCH|nr:MAG: aspartate carbamoyltransferase regulatory subunit [archaeon GW2011_AR10]HIH08869.1 aspartate carbamoyltransferase regulatory subunit [Candidatus Diapherotrites archaeon]
MKEKDSGKEKMGEKKIYITPIKEGTAIDHLAPGAALKILEVLDLKEFPVTAAMNVGSKKMGKKDLIFIEGKKLSGKETEKIALIGKGGTLNIISNASIVKKVQLNYPEEVSGIIRCINPKCISNAEGIPAKFSIKSEPLKATCFYCETRMNENEIINSIK